MKWICSSEARWKSNNSEARSQVPRLLLRHMTMLNVGFYASRGYTERLVV